MAAETYLTLAGNLTAAPKSGMSRGGSPWARLRVGSTTRVFDRAQGQWRDGDSVFLDVVCWRRLAENVVSTLERGDRVLVSGRLRQRSYDDHEGARKTVLEVEADSVGPDLVRAPARVLRAAAQSRATEAVAALEPASALEPVSPLEPVSALEPIATLEPLRAVEPLEAADPQEQPAAGEGPGFAETRRADEPVVEPALT